MSKKGGGGAKLLCKVSEDEIKRLFYSLERENAIQDIINKLVGMSIKALSDKADWWMEMKSRYNINSNNIFISYDGGIYEYKDADDLHKMKGFFFSELDSDGVRDEDDDVEDSDRDDFKSYKRMVV